MDVGFISSHFREFVPRRSTGVSKSKVISAFLSAADDDGFGDVRHKFLEMSNVSVVNEMVQMIVAQRAYEFNSKAIQTSDTMLSTAVNLKR